MRPNGARITSLAAMKRQEAAFTEHVHEAILEYVAHVRDAVEGTSVRADASPEDVNLNGLDQSAKWPDILNARILPHLSTILDSIGPPAKYALSKYALSPVAAWRAAWLQRRATVLAGVPAQITADIRDAIAAATALRGPDVSDAAKIVHSYLSPTHPQWRARAQTIARTEVVGANNQGGLASWKAVHDTIAPSGGAVFKTWLATEDAATRPDHAEVDGTEIGIGDLFDVGGDQMTGPGDDNASADQVINCRCTLTYRVDDGGLSADGRADDRAVTAAAPTVQAAPDVNGETPTGAAVLLMVSAEDAARIAVAGGEDPANLHVTLGYLADTPADLAPGTLPQLLGALAPLIGQLPIQADAFATAQFNPEDEEREPCAVLLVQSDDLATVHDDVTQVLGGLASTTFPIWVPHVTLAYQQDVDVVPDGATGQPLTFDRMVLGWAGTNYTITDPPPAISGESVTAAMEDTVTTPAPAAPALTDVDPPGTIDEDEGTQWTGPLAPLDVTCADGRMLASAGGVIRPLPLPLSFQRESSHGGEEAGQTTIVGRITSCTISGGQIQAAGDWLDPVMCFDVGEAAARVEAGLGMVSVDVAPIVVTYGARQPDGTVTEVDPMLYDGNPDDLVMVATEWELMGATLVADPAFGTARIEMTPGATLGQASETMGEPVAVTADAASPQEPALTDTSITFPNGVVINVGDPVNVIDALGSGPTAGTVTAISPADNTVTVDVIDEETGDTHSITVDAGNIQATEEAQPAAVQDAGGGGDSGSAALQAAAAPPNIFTMTPFASRYPLTKIGEPVYPAEWFQPVALDGPTHVTVTDEGRVYGHLAQDGVCHTGYLTECVTMPHSASGYAYFHLNPIETDAGPLAVGRLTVGGGHADGKLGWRGTVEHYDNVGARVAVVRAHEDDYGIQVTGAIIPSATANQITALKQSPLSGDWRPIAGTRELVAGLSVNSGGFPITPRLALSASGDFVSLVAAGIVHAPATDAEPETKGGLTLPSGTQLTSVDVAVLASAFAKAASEQQRRETVRVDLRTKLRARQRDELLASLRTARRI